MAGEFTFPHTVVSDSQGNLYVAETLGGRRSQKFVAGTTDADRCTMGVMIVGNDTTRGRQR